jgi:prepilin-type N-terminal cleavage/methylation domain-containing protein
VNNTAILCWSVVRGSLSEETELVNPDCNSGETKRRISGFTILEMLVALFVIGIASTIFINLYTSSLSLGSSSTHNAVASQIAEEYMIELQTNSAQFVWPNFDDAPIGELIPVTAIDEESPIKYIENPSAMPNIESSFARTRNLYHEFDWFAYARIHEETSNFVEVLIVVSWEHKGVDQSFYLTSAVPRSTGEGVGA